MTKTTNHDPFCECARCFFAVAEECEEERCEAKAARTAIADWATPEIVDSVDHDREQLPKKEGTGDHAARAKEEPEPIVDVVSRFMKSFVVLEPEAAPGVQIQPQANERPSVQGNAAPAAAAPPISQGRTPEPKRRPMEPAELEAQMDAIYRARFRHAYGWKEIDRTILGELREAFTAEEVLEWWQGALNDAGRSVQYVRELAALMRKEAKPQPAKRDGPMISTNQEVIAEAIWQEAPTWLGLPAGSNDDSWHVITIARELAWGIPSNLPRILRALNAPPSCIAKAEARAALT